MRRVITICAALTLSGFFLNPSLAYSQDDMVSVDDIVMLVKTDISEQTMLTFLQNRRISFTLDAAALQRLRAGDVSEEIIRFLLEQEASSVGAAPAPAPAYVVPTGYNTAYPSYYYGARLVGTTSFPLSWYSHHYYHHGYTSIYRPNASHGLFSDSVSRPATSSLGHDRDPVHLPGTYGGDHQVSHSNQLRGHSSSGNHSLGHSSGHSTSH